MMTLRPAGVMAQTPTPAVCLHHVTANTCVELGWLLVFYFLSTSMVNLKIAQCILVMVLQCCPTERPCRQHHVLPSHIILPLNYQVLVLS